MKEKLRRVGRGLGRLVERALGVLGGLIWAFFGWFTAILLYAVLHYPPMLLLTVCILLPVGFGFWGFLKPAYLSLFSGPFLSAFMGDGFEAEKKAEFFLPLALFGSLFLLIAGLLFQIYAVTGFGVTVFIGYAFLAPRVFRDGISEPDPVRNGGAPTR